MTLALALGVPWVLATTLGFADGRRPLVGFVAAMGLLANFVALTALLGVVLRDGTLTMVAGSWPAGVGIALRADMLGVSFALLASGVLLVAFVYEFLRGIQGRFFPGLVLFMATGLTGLFLTGDAFNFYVFFEVAMTSAFVLTSYGGQPRRLRATLIFVSINLLGSVLFLISIGALYRVTGTLDMVDMASRVKVVHPNALALIGALLLAAFGLKIGLFPLHTWLPPVYRDSSSAVAAILSGALANIGSYGLLRFGGSILPDVVRAGEVLLIALGAASILYGAVLALSRFPTREVLAYSSIGQAGYVMIAIAVGGPVGYAAAVLYAIVNSLNKTVLFLSAGLRGWPMGAAFAIGAFSVAGVPPAAGFLGKAGVFRAGIAAENPVLVALVFLGGALSLVYMFQIYQRDYWLGRPGTGATEARSPASARVLVMLLAVLLVAIGLWPEPLISLSEAASTSVNGGLP